MDRKRRTICCYMLSAFPCCAMSRTISTVPVVTGFLVIESREDSYAAVVV